MRHPLEAIAASRRRVVFGALVAMTLALMAVLLSVDREFPPGIVAFELVRDGDLAAAMVAGWDATARAWVGFSLGLDYVYLFAYSMTIGLACIMLGSSLRDRGARGIAALAAPVAWMQWLAAGFDAVENATLLHTLTSAEQPRFATPLPAGNQRSPRTRPASKPSRDEIVRVRAFGRGRHRGREIARPSPSRCEPSPA